MSNLSRLHAEPTYRRLTKVERSKTYFAGFTLEQLFEPRGHDTLEETLINLTRRARWRTIGVFRDECEQGRGRRNDTEECDHKRGSCRSTDNYITGLRNELSDLVKYVQVRARNPVVHKCDLASRFWRVDPQDLEMILEQASEKLLVAALLQMHAPFGTDIWYDEGRGSWQLTQSCADEPRLAHAQINATRNAVKGYYDSRTYHGRNGKQARKRDRANGNAYRSTGFSSQIK